MKNKFTIDPSVRLFQNVWKLPFKIEGFCDTHVCDSEDNFAFQIQAYDLPKNQLKKLIDIINGEREVDNDNHYEHIKGYIYRNGKELLLIRGWGRLTGNGFHALGLESEQAREIQDDLAAYICERLTKKKSNEKTDI